MNLDTKKHFVYVKENAAKICCNFHEKNYMRDIYAFIFHWIKQQNNLMSDKTVEGQEQSILKMHPTIWDSYIKECKTQIIQ